MYFVYILQSIPKSAYIYKGMTINIERRLAEHQNGRVPSTRNYLPLRLIHVEICDTRLEARAIEKMFKSGYGREIVKQLLHD